MVKVRFYGALRLELSQDTLVLYANSTGQLFDMLREHISKLRDFNPKNFLIFVNKEKVRSGYASLNSGDEVAIMPKAG